MGLKIQIHVCGTYVLSVWFTLLIGFGSVWIFSRWEKSILYPSNVQESQGRKEAGIPPESIAGGEGTFTPAVFSTSGVWGKRLIGCSGRWQNV